MLLAVVFVILSFFAEEKLLPLNNAWMRFGLLLGRLISPIVLGLIFFLIISPVSVLSRIAGRDELRISGAVQNTYWRVRTPAGSDRSSFFDQF